MKNIILDVGRMEFDEQGVHKFVWPLAREEVLAVRDAFLPPLVTLARESSSPDDEDAELLSIVVGHFVAEAMALYQAHALCRRFATLDLWPTEPERSRLLPALKAGVAPPLSPFLKSLHTGPSRLRTGIGLALQRIWFSVKWNESPLPGLRPVDLERDIVTARTHPLINCHARAVPDIVQLSYLGNWFTPLEEKISGGISQNAIAPSIIDTAVEAIDAGFAAGNEQLPDYLADYLRNWLAEATGQVRFHLHALLRQPDQLPRRLWTGTGGNIWTRILRHATRRIGGTVTGHDHGSGVGHIVSIDKPIVEFESCDIFVTFNESQAAALKKNLCVDLLIPSPAPDIIGVPNCRKAPREKLSKSSTSQLQPQSLKIRKVMYVSTLYDGERVHFSDPLLPDLVAVDWQTRLLSHLGTWGYEVLHKPHPGGSIRPPAGLAERFGGRTLIEQFEQAMNTADVFIFDYPATTTFGVALVSGKPVVLVDFGIVNFTPEARELLERRCRIVKGWFDDANRAQVDWDELREAIEESCDLMDTSFVDTYLKSPGGLFLGAKRPIPIPDRDH